MFAFSFLKLLLKKNDKLVCVYILTWARKHTGMSCKGLFVSLLMVRTLVFRWVGAL